MPIQSLLKIATSIEKQKSKKGLIKIINAPNNIKLVFTLLSKLNYLVMS